MPLRGRKTAESLPVTRQIDRIRDKKIQNKSKNFRTPKAVGDDRSEKPAVGQVFHRPANKLPSGMEVVSIDLVTKDFKFVRNDIFYRWVILLKCIE